MKSLESLAGTPTPFTELAALHPGAPWLEAGEELDEVEVDVVGTSVSVASLRAGEGPWALFVDGNLDASGDLDFFTTDYAISLLVVRGHVTCRNFRFTNGANCFIEGNLTCSGFVVGRYGDESANLEVGGTVKARALLLDHVTGVTAESIEAIVRTTEGFGLPIDLSANAETEGDVFAATTLDRDGALDLGALWDEVAEGRDPFVPGVETALRAKRPDAHPSKRA